MARFAQGKYSLAISDISGQAFPWNEMVTQWNGLFVHFSEFESKQPQIRRRTVKADAIALQNTRSQDFTLKSGGSRFTTIDLVLPGEFSFQSSGMQPDNGAEQNRQRQLISTTGTVTVSIT